MSKILVGVGVVCLVLGGVWALQGVGVLGGSFMSGSGTWLVIGLLVAIAGVALVYQGLRGRQRT
jgi:hypothetical protein